MTKSVTKISKIPQDSTNYTKPRKNKENVPDTSEPPPTKFPKYFSKNFQNIFLEDFQNIFRKNFTRGEKPDNKRMTEGTNQKTIITHLELNKMAKERGMKGYHNLRKLELAERLGIELSEPTGKLRGDQGKPRRACRVEAVNPDGTMMVYASISAWRHRRWGNTLCKFTPWALTVM